jgi:beta-lactamase regulating signal transducer with metallopeptidase domain
MTPISQTLVTYFVNAPWQVPAIAVVCLLAALLIRQFPSVCLHRLWVAALLASVLIPLAPDLVDAISSTQSIARPHLQPPAAASSTPAFSWSILDRRYQVTLDPRSLAILAGSYFCFLFYRVFRLLGSCYQTTRLLRSSTPAWIPRPVLEILRDTPVRDALASLNIHSSDLASAPFTVGHRPPVLVFPWRFSESTSAHEQASAICHELAHIRRHDFLLNLLYEIVSLPISFHPITPWIKSRISSTREFICDESAATVVSAPRAYAESLLNIAQYLTVAPRFVPVIQ